MHIIMNKYLLPAAIAIMSPDVKTEGGAPVSPRRFTAIRS